MSKPSYQNQIEAIKNACELVLESTHTYDRVLAIGKVRDLADGLQHTDYIPEYPANLVWSGKKGDAQYRILQVDNKTAIVQKFIGPEKSELNHSANQIPEWWTASLSEAECADIFMLAFLYRLGCRR